MKKLCFAVLMIAFFSLNTQAFGFFGRSADDPQVVDAVDFNRYVGTWLEIAHNPNFFQKGCVRSSAEYGLISSTEVSVRNTCVKDDGSLSDIQGVATVEDPAVPAKLKVKFNFFARGDYWIIDLDPNYQWAVVSAPEKKSLFILARQAPMESKLLENILTSLKARCFNTDELIFDRY